MSDVRGAAERWENSGGFGASFEAECFEDVYTLAAAYMESHPSDGPSDTEMLEWLEERGDLFLGTLLDGTRTIMGIDHFTPSPTLRDAIRNAMKGTT